MKNFTKATIITGLISSSALYAINAPHTAHTIYTKNNSAWDIRITEIAPNENAYFQATDMPAPSVVKSPILDLTIPAYSQAGYDFGFGEGTDFNVAYTITAIQKNTEGSAQSGKTTSCTFVVGANGPANPNINVLNYQDANCSYKVIPGQGEDFYLSTKS